MDRIEKDIDQEESRARYLELSEEAKQIQASFWALTFLIGELAALNRLLRSKLVEHGILSEEEDQYIDEQMTDKQILSAAYNQAEKAFFSKYQQVRFALENPEVVEEAMKASSEEEKES